MDSDDFFDGGPNTHDADSPASESTSRVRYVFAAAAALVLALGLAFMAIDGVANGATPSGFSRIIATVGLVGLAGALVPDVWRWTRKLYSARADLAKERRQLAEQKKAEQVRTEQATKSQTRERLLAICAKCNSATTISIKCEKCFGRTWEPGRAADGSSGWFCSSCKSGFTSFTCQKCNHRTPVIVKNFGVMGDSCENVFVAGRGMSDEQARGQQQRDSAAFGCLWLIALIFVVGAFILAGIARMTH
jgi:hypothetical protein